MEPSSKARQISKRRQSAGLKYHKKVLRAREITGWAILYYPRPRGESRFGMTHAKGI